jgi:hypothetical protein
LAVFLAAGASAEEIGKRRWTVLVPGDLGPAEIDVSSYPARFQTVYRDLFLTKCSVCHSPARAVNSEFLEATEEEIAAFKAKRPADFAAPEIIKAEPDIWKRYVKKMKMRPPCCGACPVMTQENSRDIWEFLVYDSKARKTGDNAARWSAHRRELIRRFAEQQKSQGGSPQ